MSRDNRKSDVIMNEDITAKELRCTSDDGENYGIIPTSQALTLADEAGLDLVLIAPDANPPVAKIMDYSKFKYQQEKRKKEAKKNQKVIVVKEIKLSVKIADAGVEVLNKVWEKVEDIANKDKDPKLEGRYVNLLVTPKKD